MRILSAAVLLLGVLVLGPSSAEAQDQRTLKKASRLIGPDETAEDLRLGFQMLSDALRSAPNMATPQGWWLRGEAAGLLTMRDPPGLGTAEVAIESFREAAKAGIVEPNLSALVALEKELTARATAHSSATTLAESQTAHRAALLLVSADIVRQKLDVSKPVDRVRRMALATEAAIAAHEVRSARQLFLDLDRQGGFIEPLALAVTREVEAQEGAGLAFRFLEELRERHPHNKTLLATAVDVCLQQGWSDEARSALDALEPHYKDTYENHMLLGGYRDALGDHAAAAERYRSAIRHAPAGYDANWLLATLLVRLADAEEDPLLAEPLRTEALVSLATVLTSNPDNTGALRLVAHQSELLEIEIDPEIQTRLELLEPSAAVEHDSPPALEP